MKLDAFAVGCTVVAVAIGTLAIVDFAVTESRLPALPADCPPPNTDACVDARNAAVDRWAAVVRDRSDDYRGRAWLYAFLLTAAVAAPGIRSLIRRPEPAVARRVFTTFGVIGVGLGIAAALLLYLKPYTDLDAPYWPAFLPFVLLASAGLVGGIVVRFIPGSRDAQEEAQRRSKLGRTARVAAIAGWLLTVTTFVLAFIFAGPQPACGGAEQASAPDWTGAVFGIAVATTVLAAICSVVALAGRRWISAAIIFFANPAALIFMAASTCAFY
jgi:hypothetical protein